MKINGDIQIGETNVSLGTLNTKVNNLTETILWEGQKKINTTKNNTVTLTGMPSLANYQNKILRLYVGYNGDMIIVKEYYLQNPSTVLFLDIVRDYSGQNDIWINMYAFTYLATTSWIVKTNISLQIQGTSLSDIGGSSSYSFYIYKVSIVG